jgi:phosphatidylserine decarboxylase
MWITFALLGAVISTAGMLLLAWKWNLSISSILMGAITMSLAASLPFLGMYRSNRYDWLLLLSIGGQIALAMALALGIILYRFWRDPDRTPPQEDGVILSPADGKVIYVKTVHTGATPLVTKDGQDYSLQELTGCGLDQSSMAIVGIDMNILNVHVNRCPIDGEVKLVKHIEGKFNSLRNRVSPFINARCTTIIANELLTVATVQIASRLVRRVDNYLSPGQIVSLGCRLGKIRFGSQVAVIFPNREDMHIEVHTGQTVMAGTSILAYYSPKNTADQRRDVMAR